MIEPYFSLSGSHQREALEVAAAASGRPEHLLEKDIWVVWALQQLFTAEFGDYLAFKGGTSLSKVYRVITRFSEDIDLTWDIRQLIPDHIAKAGGSTLPSTSTQARKWTDAIRNRLSSLLREQVVPRLGATILTNHLAAQVQAVEPDKIYVHYEQVSRPGVGYTQAQVQLEFGARATGEPDEVRQVTCDAARHLPGVAFPEASVKTLRAERTFWEKAMAAHVYCIQGRFRGNSHFSRHWYDLVQLDNCGVAAQALGDRVLAQQVADHKNLFFAEKAPDGTRIDYVRSISGGLRLVPEGTALDSLRADYAAMSGDGLLPEGAEEFDALLTRCRLIEITAATAARVPATNVSRKVGGADPS